MFKLRYSTTSPFVRKVSVTIIECGLENQVERELTNPWAPETDLPATNPLGKVPALRLENGQVLFDSPVICEFLDSLSSVPRLFPKNSKERWSALMQQALGDGMMEAAVGRLLESRRPAQEQSQAAITRYAAAVRRSLDHLDSNIQNITNGFNIGQLTIACALEYLDFRFPTENWREGRPNLTKWHESVANRPSLQQTVPHD